MVTMAPCSRAPSATANPMPDEPPRIRMFEFTSLDVYLVDEEAILVVLVRVLGRKEGVEDEN